MRAELFKSTFTRVFLSCETQQERWGVGGVSDLV